MDRNSTLAKILRITGIILMSLTGAFTLLGGLGTSCVAFNPTGFGPAFIKLRNMQWLYILFVVVTSAVGVMGIRAVVLLVKGRKNAYRYSMIALLLGLVVGVIHMLVSQSLRGKSMPVDAVVYTTVLTLVYFLIIRIPGIWAGVDYAKETGDKIEAGGAAAIVMGFMTLSIQYLMSSTHTIGGINYADAWHLVMSIAGGFLVLAGTTVLIFSEKLVQQKTVHELK